MPTILTDLLHDCVARYATLPPFGEYVDPDAIAVVGSRGRAGPSGKRAECHFTRFDDRGAPRATVGRWTFPRIEMKGREIRYVISFVLPRFLFLPPEEQAADIVHELLHIHPAFDGRGSPLQHGRGYDRKVAAIAALGAARGLAVPALAREGEVVLYRRFRPFPRPFRLDDPEARPHFSDGDLEVAALRLDVRDRHAPAARYTYRCPACGLLYRRRRPMRAASCGRCSPRFDARFRLEPADR